MELATRRLLLREVVESDWEAVWAYQQDEAYGRYGDGSQREAEAVREWIKGSVGEQKQEPRDRFQLAVVAREEGRLAGLVSLRVLGMGTGEGEIGYEIAPQWWGRGYATEAVERLARWGFEELSLVRLWAWCLAENEASQRVLAKLDFRLQNRLCRSRWMQGRWWDRTVWRLERTAWVQAQHRPRALVGAAVGRTDFVETGRWGLFPVPVL